jgi:hemoglobin-like flavoprotein
VARPKRLSELTIEELPPFKPRQGRHAGRETEEEEWGAVEWVRWSITQLPVNNQRILTDIFYDELFSMAPDTRALFAEDMDPQKDRLLSALLAAARHMDNPDGVEHHLRAWGVIHRRLGVTDEMYVYVGQALVRTIGRLLTNDFTQVHSSWVAVYQWMAAVMIDAADEADGLLSDGSRPASP